MNGGESSRGGGSGALVLAVLGPLIGSVIFVVLPKPSGILPLFSEDGWFIICIGYFVGLFPATATAIIFAIVDKRALADISRPGIALALGSAFSLLEGAFIFRDSGMGRFIPGAAVLQGVLIFETTLCGGAAAFLIVYFMRSTPSRGFLWRGALLRTHAEERSEIHRNSEDD